MYNGMTSDQELRGVALDRALHYHQNREARPADILATAKEFTAFLKGESA